MVRLPCWVGPPWIVVVVVVVSPQAGYMLGSHAAWLSSPGERAKVTQNITQALPKTESGEDLEV